jgi:transposase InsO family protein
MPRAYKHSKSTAVTPRPTPSTSSTTSWRSSRFGSAPSGRIAATSSRRSSTGTSEHVYVKPGTPQLNGKVERSHRTDKDEFYQLITYRDDVNLAKKLMEWERFYNYERPHGAHRGRTPYEALKEKLQ